jgi:hypothetical protein
MIIKVERCMRPTVGDTHKNYTKALKWSLLSNIALSTEVVMGSHSMLTGLNETVSSHAISTQYIGKDAIGQAASLYYINRSCKKADTNTSSFIKKNSAIQQIGIFAESITPIIDPSLFLATAAFGSIITNTTCATFGAVNAKLVQNMGDGNNTGEIFSKLAITNIFGSTVGMCLGLAICRYIPDHHTRLTVLPFLACIRIYAQRKCFDSILSL